VPPYLVSKLQRLRFSVDSELMALYDSFPRRIIALRSGMLNRMMAYSESCFVCWCNQCKLFTVVHAEQTVVIVT